LLEMIEISQGFKTFWVYLKALLENYFKLSIIFLKNFFEKDQVSKYYFSSLFKPMQACLQKKCFTKWFIEFALPKECLKNIFQKLFL
jgi:hypothetical protein